MKYPFFKNIYIVGIAIISFLFILSCDKINEPYLTKNKTNTDTTSVDTTSVDTTSVDTNTTFKPKKKIILEEITGHKCVNCPAAHVVLQKIINDYGHKVIGIAIHATNFANPDGSGNFTADYRTTEGTKLAADYGATYAPTGFINRTKYQNTYLQGKDKWTEVVYQFLKDENAKAHLEIKNSYTNSDGIIKTNIKGTFYANLEGSYNLCVLITEDSIVSPQKTNEEGVANGYYPSYNHMHMLRKYMTDIYGETVAINQVDSAFTFNKTYQFKINNNWKAKNCKIVAFITKEDTKEIIQAEEKKFIELK